MFTLVLSPTNSEDSRALDRAARDSGWQVERMDGWRVPDWLMGRDDLAFYGEALFVRAVAEQAGYSLLEAQPAWLADLPMQYKSRSVQAMKLGDAEQITSPAFIKPAADKAFPSRVYESGEEFLAGVTELSRNINILVSEPVRWQIEYRCFVSDRRIDTLAMYERDGSLTKVDGVWPQTAPSDAEALAFSQSVAADAEIDVPPAFVMDIGLIEGRGWAVLEANPAWGSGIYGCDAAKVLPVVARACVKTSGLSEPDRRWVPAWESWYEDGG